MGTSFSTARSYPNPEEIRDRTFREWAKQLIISLDDTNRDIGISQKTLRSNDIITKSPWRDVRAYGADPTGTTDSLAAFKLALTEGTAFAPAGTYAISDTLQRDDDGDITIIGVGRETILQFTNAAMNSLFAPVLDGTAGGRLVLKNLSVLVATTDYTGSLIKLESDAGDGTFGMVELSNLFLRNTVTKAGAGGNPAGKAIHLLANGDDGDFIAWANIHDILIEDFEYMIFLEATNPAGTKVCFLNGNNFNNIQGNACAKMIHLDATGKCNINDNKFTNITNQSYAGIPASLTKKYGILLETDKSGSTPGMARNIFVGCRFWDGSNSSLVGLAEDYAAPDQVNQFYGCTLSDYENLGIEDITTIRIPNETWGIGMADRILAGGSTTHALWLDTADGDDTANGLIEATAVKTAARLTQLIPYYVPEGQTLTITVVGNMGSMVFPAMVVDGSVIFRGKSTTPTAQSTGALVFNNIQSGNGGFLLEYFDPDVGVTFNNCSGVKVSTLALNAATTFIKANHSNIWLDSIAFSNITGTCIEASNCSHIISSNHSGGATKALLANTGGVIAKGAGSQPTGTEVTATGGVIR